jgi:protocatechuate 3,4-dioxygenase beta subunit
MSRPACFQEAFVLCVLEGKSGSEAAVLLGCKEGTVKSRVNRARRQLQQRLARRGISLGTLLAALSIADGATAAGLPAVLAHVTIRSGLVVAAGEPAAGVIPAHVATLAAGVTQAMFLTKAKIVTTVLLTVGLLAASAGALAYRGFTANGADQPPASDAKPAPKPQATKPTDTIEIAGRVLDPDGKPIAGAKLYQAYRVEFIDRDAPPAPKVRGTTGPDGRFHFTIPKADLTSAPRTTLQVVAIAKGFGPDWVEIQKPAAGELTLRLVKDDVPITGRILDLEGKPIRGAVIRPSILMTTPEENLTPWLQDIKDKKRFQHRDMLKKQLIGFPFGIPGLPETLTTGADGRFRLTGVGRERVVAVRISGPKVRSEFVMMLTRALPKFQAFDNPSSDDKFTIYGATFEHFATPPKPMIGTVRDKDTGKPLAGVKIDAAPARPVYTDKDGKYRFDSLPGDGLGGRNDFGIPVLAIPPADQPYLVGFQEVKFGPGVEAMTVDFNLKRGVWVQGKVTNKATGNPVAARIEYRISPDNPHRKDAADFARFPSLPADLYRTRSDGTFRIPVLPGPGVLTAHGPYGDFIAAGTADINPGKDGEPAACAIALDPGRTLTGTILGPDGQPLTGVHVFGMKPRDFWTPQPLKTAYFTLTAVDPRRSRSLIFLHPEKRWVKAVELQGNAQDKFTVRLEPAGTITGRLVDEDGQPRPDVNLLIHFVRKDNDYVAEHLPARIKTDREGRFRVEGLAPGVVYQINLAGKPPNITTGSVANRLSVKSGETKDLGDVKGKLFQD